MTTPGVRARLGRSSEVLRAVARNPALRRVEIAFLLFTAVEFGTWVAILLYAYAATGRASVGVVALVQLLPAALVAPFAASLADRFDRALVLAAAYLAQAAAFGGAAAGILLGAPPPVVYAFATAAAIAIGVTRPTQGALLPSLSRTPAELIAANAAAGTMEGAGLLLGPLGAAALLAVGAPGHVLVAGTIACVLAALLVTRLPVRRTAKGVAEAARGASVAVDEHPHGHVGVTAGLRVIAARGETRLVVLLLALRMATSGAMDVLFVLLALDVFATGESGAAVLNAALGAGTVLGGAATFSLVGRQRLAPAMALSAAVLGAALATVGVAGRSDLAPFLIAAGGLGYAATDVVGRTILQRVTPDEVLARVLGALEGVGLAALALGSIAVPLIAGAVGAVSTLLFVAVALPLGVVVAWRGLARVDREVLVPVRALALLGAAKVFAPLPPPQLEWVARRARWITAEPGAFVIREGDVGDAYYVLESGRMRVTRDGVELRTTEGYGDGFGEIALLHDVRRTASIVALEPSVLLSLDRADFLEAVTGHEHARTTAERVAQERAPAPPEA